MKEINTKKDHRPYIDDLGKRIAGFKQSIKELFGEKKVKFIFALLRLILFL